MIKIVQRRKIWFTLSLILFTASIGALLTWGLRFGIDFTGGTLMEIGFKNKTLSSEEIKTSLKDLNLGEINVQFSDKKTVLLRFKDVDEDTHQKIITALNLTLSPEGGDSNASAETLSSSAEEKVENTKAVDNSENSEEKSEAVGIEKIGEKTETAEVIEEKRFESIGPVIGNELKSSAFWALILSLVGIVLYISWAFRKVSRPISSFNYGFIAIIALFHDIVITMGIFAVLGHFLNVEVGIPFMAALLTVLGYSVNDTIVVFDRTRENLLKADIDDFEEVVNKSVNETLIRSLNTSFTTLLVLAALFLFGGETIKYFVVALFVGIFFGTYSSIFIASPLLVSWQRWKFRKQSR